MNHGAVSDCRSSLSKIDNCMDRRDLGLSGIPLVLGEKQVGKQ